MSKRFRREGRWVDDLVREKPVRKSKRQDFNREMLEDDDEAAGVEILDPVEADSWDDGGIPRFRGIRK